MSEECFIIKDEKEEEAYLTSCGSGNVEPRSNKILIISAKVEKKFH